MKCTSSPRLKADMMKVNSAGHIAHTLWRKLRAGAMFIVACFTSPCCTPLIVPVILSLLAGTPVALWLSQNIGWVYGGLTLISAVSFVLALRWMSKNTMRRRASPTSHEIKEQPLQA